MKNKKMILIVFIMILSSFIEPKKSNSQTSKNIEITKVSEHKSLKGTYKRTKWGIYTALEFKGKSTVVIHSIGLEFVASYKLDGKLIRIVEDGKSGTLLLEIINATTIIGHGVAKGTYKKQ